MTEGFGKSEAGGFFGPELKFAGYDAIIVEGKSAEPCYIAIHNDKVEIKSAKHLWGKDTGPVQDRITSYNVCYTKLLRRFSHRLFLFFARLK